MVAGEVKNSSELANCGASDCKENITEAAADSSATDEIEVPFGRVVQGEARDSEYSLSSRKFVTSNFAWPYVKFFPLPQEFEQVQGEVLPSNCVTHQDGCDSLEQSSGAAECDDIEAPLSFSCLKVYSSPLNKHFVLLA